MSYIVVDESSKQINQGDVVTSFRGEPAVFEMISQVPLYGSSGKIVVTEYDHKYEFYPSVFDLKIIEGD